MCNNIFVQMLVKQYRIFAMFTLLSCLCTLHKLVGEIDCRMKYIDKQRDKDKRTDRPIEKHRYTDGLARQGIFNG